MQHLCDFKETITVAHNEHDVAIGGFRRALENQRTVMDEVQMSLAKVENEQREQRERIMTIEKESELNQAREHATKATAELAMAMLQIDKLEGDVSAAYGALERANAERDAALKRLPPFTGDDEETK